MSPMGKCLIGPMRHLPMMGICRHGYMSHGYMSPNPARTLHLRPFLALFGHKMGQNGWNKKHMLWISIQVNPNDNLKALVSET